MKSSIEIKNISEALIKAQSEFPPVAFDSNNPYFKSRYASLGAVLSTVRPILIKHGLGIIQLPYSENGNVGVTTRLLHTSGEWYEETVTIPLKSSSEKVQIAQAAGIVITYLRRYSISAVLGLYSEEDTDGGMNDGYEKPPKQLKARVKAKRNEPVEEVEEEESLVDQFGHMWNKARALGNEEGDLPKLKKSDGEKEIIEKLAELAIIIKNSEEGE